ncbi:MAG TPA: DUF952 domain-containing protein [Kosmotogaceae bacterium]|nr:DUF952 domain-containing protein [Kosmotogaceae bacterium]
MGFVGGVTLKRILHIASKETWNEALPGGYYTPESYESEGFIHCSTPEQVIEVANHLFRARRGLILLVIEEDKVDSPVKYEDPGNGSFYPHIYGPLNISAVVKVVAFEPLSNGCFALPDIT